MAYAYIFVYDAVSRVVQIDVDNRLYKSNTPKIFIEEQTMHEGTLHSHLEWCRRGYSYIVKPYEEV